MGLGAHVATSGLDMAGGMDERGRGNALKAWQPKLCNCGDLAHRMVLRRMLSQPLADK